MWSFGFFIATTTANDLRLWRISIPNFIHYIYFPILILEIEAVFPISMLSAKQGNHRYHFNNIFGMTRSLTADWTQHNTTRLSRRRFNQIIYCYLLLRPYLLIRPLFVGSTLEGGLLSKTLLYCQIYYNRYFYRALKVKWILSVFVLLDPHRKVWQTTYILKR